MHRDIKPENVLINPESLQIKICDFGSAKSVDEGSNIPYVVSRFYRAPELILACSGYGTEIDIWAAGCIFIEIFTGVPAFIGKNDGDQLFKQIDLLGGIPSSCSIIERSPIDKEVLKGLLISKEKADLRQVFERCPKAESLADLVGNMLKFEPKERLTAEQCLAHPFFENFSELIKCN